MIFTIQNTKVHSRTEKENNLLVVFFQGIIEKKWNLKIWDQKSGKIEQILGSHCSFLRYLDSTTKENS
jgi:hypothetical protein